MTNLRPVPPDEAAEVLDRFARDYTLNDPGLWQPPLPLMRRALHAINVRMTVWDSSAPEGGTDTSEWKSKLAGHILDKEWAEAEAMLQEWEAAK